MGACFKCKTNVNGSMQLVCCNPSFRKPHDPKCIYKDIVYTIPMHSIMCPHLSQGVHQRFNLSSHSQDFSFKKIIIAFFFKSVLDLRVSGHLDYAVQTHQSSDT